MANMTVNTWLDTHMEYMNGRKLRIINTDTGKGVSSDMLILYINKRVKAVKIATRFLFIYV